MTGLAAKPGELALGVVARVALRIEDRVVEVEFAGEQLQRLLVSVRFERLAGRRETQGENAAHLFHQPAGEHGLAALVQALAERVAAGLQAEFQHAVSGERVAAFAKQLAHRTAGEETDFHGARHLGHVVGMDSGGGLGIEAFQQAVQRAGRFDLKDSKSQIALEGKDAIILHSADEFKLKAINDLFQQKLVKRGVPLKGLSYGVVEPAAGSTSKQKITMQQGIPIEKAREIVKLVKDSKKKVQASIQGDLVRVSGKDRDTLQEIMALLRQKDFGIDMQFTNYRTN